jgi:hypothetical protein
MIARGESVGNAIIRLTELFDLSVKGNAIWRELFKKEYLELLRIEGVCRRAKLSGNRA